MGKSTKGIPRPNARGIRPQVWVTGPDPVEHHKYRVFIQQKNQAQFREEGWTITFEQWKDLWKDLWESRGREKGTYCMSRKDWSLPWTPTNVAVITREAHARMQADARNAGWCSIAQKRQRERKGLADVHKTPGRKPGYKLNKNKGTNGTTTTTTSTN